MLYTVVLSHTKLSCGIAHSSREAALLLCCGPSGLLPLSGLVTVFYSTTKKNILSKGRV